MIAHILFSTATRVDIPCSKCECHYSSDDGRLYAITIKGVDCKVQYINADEVLMVYTTMK